jgi:hypothetical protein
LAASKFLKPPGHGFIRLGTAIPVVVSGADHQWPQTGDPGEVFFDHQRLDLGFQDGSDIQEVSTDHHQVVSGRRLSQPVKLLQRVVKVCDEQDAHVQVKKS